MKIGMRELVFILILLAVPVASFWYVFRPQSEKIKQANQEIEHKESMLQSLAETTAQTDDLAAANEEIANAIHLIEARLPTHKEVDVILEQVAEIALGNNLKLIKVKSDKPVRSAAYWEQPLEMKVAGDFNGFYAFLLDLEQLDRITRMPHIKLKRADEVDGVINATFTLSIYFESDEESEGA